MYAIMTQGQGDLDIQIVDDEVWNFIDQGEPLSEETLTKLLAEEPEDNREYIKECYEDYLNSSKGSSPENDRALFVMGRLGNSIHSLKEFLDYLRLHPEIKIEDTYEGYIY